MKETLEKNKLIAEFMEAGKDGKFFMVGQLLYLPEEMEYHTSWDWLLPAYQRFHQIAEDRLEMDWKSISFCSEFVSGVVTGNIQRSLDALYNGINWYTLSQGEKQL